jgi:hypothetical protein
MAVPYFGASACEDFESRLMIRNRLKPVLLLRNNNDKLAACRTIRRRRTYFHGPERFRHCSGKLLW